MQWCPKDQTVLANEQVIDGHCERCGTLVVQRRLSQWFFKITDYAQRLLDDFELLDSWPEHVVTMQRNWIGRSEGAEVTFRCEELDLDFPVFTTRPDTLFGATFFVIAPEHPDVERLVAGTEHEEAVRDYVNEAARASTEDRGDEDRAEDRRPHRARGHQPRQRREDPGLRRRLRPHGLRHRRPDGGPRPRPARLGLRQGVRPADPARSIEPAGGRRPRRADEAYTETGDAGRIVNSGEFDGLTPAEAIEKITAWLAEEGRGEATVNYRLRDWLISRQRYWGAPIPIVHCDACGLVPVPEDELPVLLPDIEDYSPEGESPLAAADGLGQHRVPEVRRRGEARHRHDGHLRRLLLVLHPLPRPPQRRRAVGPRRRRPLDAGRPVHRRGRARDPAPDVRALLLQGARGHGPARRPGAVPEPLHPGDDHPRRGEDVQVEGQHRQPPRVRRALRRRRHPHLHLLHGPAGQGRRLDRRGRRGSLPLPRAPLAPLAERSTRRPHGRRPRTRVPRARRASCSRRPTGRSTRSPATSTRASSSTPRSPR